MNSGSMEKMIEYGNWGDKATPERRTKYSKTERHMQDIAKLGLDRFTETAAKSLPTFLVVLDSREELCTRIRIKDNAAHLNIRSASAKTSDAGKSCRFPSLYSA
jgi:hypothetical protein